MILLDKDTGHHGRFRAEDRGIAYTSSDLVTGYLDNGRSRYKVGTLTSTIARSHANPYYWREPAIVSRMYITYNHV